MYVMNLFFFVSNEDYVNIWYYNTSYHIDVTCLERELSSFVFLRIINR